MTNIEIVQQAIDKYLAEELPKQVEGAGGWENYCIKEAFKEFDEETIKLMESIGIEP
jgi:hypothetical protein